MMYRLCSYAFQGLSRNTKKRIDADCCQCLHCLFVAENWAEGDRMRALGMTVLKHCDRQQADLPASQIFFLERYLLPTFEQLARVMPEVGQQALAIGLANKVKWAKLQQKGVKALEAVAKALHGPEPTPAASRGWPAEPGHSGCRSGAAGGGVEGFSG
jgi:hypothetical protein